MKKLTLCFALFICNMLMVNELWSQVKADATAVPKLNQLELVRQFIGKWQSVVGKDTTDIIEYQQFGNAIVSRCNRFIKGKEFPLFALDAGFSAESNQLKVFVLFSSGDYVTVNCSFKTARKLTGEYLPDFNQEVVISRFEDEFISPDEYKSTTYDKDGAKIEEVKWTRIK